MNKEIKKTKLAELYNADLSVYAEREDLFKLWGKTAYENKLKGITDYLYEIRMVEMISDLDKKLEEIKVQINKIESETDE
jgi:hypothetical protein